MVEDISSLIFTVSQVTESEEGGIKLKEDEWIPAILTQFTPWEGQFGKQIRWVFELQGKEYTWKSKNGKTGQFRITGSTSYVCSPRSKLYKWYAKIIGKDPEIGEKIDLKTILNKSCYIMIKITKGINRNGEEMIYHNVEKIKTWDNTTEILPTLPKTKEEPKIITEVKEEETKEKPEKEGDIFDDVF